MSKVKTRQNLVLLHLFAASFLAPVFIMLAITGGLYLSDNKPETQAQDIALPAGTQIDPDSPTLEQDIRDILARENIDVEFEYLRERKDSIQTRPTSRTYVQFDKEDDGWTAQLHTPSFHYSMMELHKGHGPQAFKIFQILAAIALFMIVMSGFVIGLISPPYRKKTLITSGLGALTFIVLAFVI